MRLSAKTLGSLPAAVERPRYDRSAVRTGIVHLGIGAFARAHQAVYLDDVLGRGDPGWGITAASLRSPETRDALAPQDGLYAVAVRSGGGTGLRVIGSVGEVVVARGGAAALIARMCDPGVRIVTLTVTEKGYCHDPASGELDEAHPDIRHDLAAPDAPRSAPGLLVAALAARKAAGVPPFTVLTCDNLPANGVTVKRVISRLAALRSADLGAWVAGEVACPSTMVDRIVPATTAQDKAAIGADLGLEDAWPVVTEPFTQWVVEDHFPAGRPDLEAVGVQMAADVTPFEHMKLRLLNASHSAIAYLGYLAGHDTISEVIAEPVFARYVRAMMDEEITSTLHMPAGVDVEAYKDELVARFRNPALRHRTWQIAMDGSQKLPQRMLGTIRDRLAAGAPFPRLALAVAGWMRYVAGTDERGRPIDVQDPLADVLRRVADAAGPEPDSLVPALLGVTQVFGGDLPADPRLREAVTQALTALSRQGAARAVEALCAGGVTGAVR
jgi:fructuronate reductase